jgi:hypothetical protein
MVVNGQVIVDDAVSIAIPARGSVTRQPFACFTRNETQAAQLTYSGTDANGNAVSVSSGNIDLIRR